MPELNALAEWLGYEVVDVEGEAVVRHRVGSRGRWVEREARATAAEVTLYDGLRALAALHGGDGGLEAMASVLRVLGLPSSATFEDALKQVVHMHERARVAESQSMSLGQKVEDLASQNAALTREKNLPRLTPKGGDRNEFVRQVRHTAKAASEQRSAHPGQELTDISFRKGVTAMANTVLHLLGEPPLHHTAGEKMGERLDVPVVAEDPAYQEVIQAVEQLRADHEASHYEGTRMFYLNKGEQTAYRNVLALLANGRCGNVSLEGS
jgi:hypothetical protein